MLRYIVVVGLLAVSAPVSADPVMQWNANAGKAAVAACISPANDPLHESRLYAMMHVAIHDALNAIARRSRPYAYDVRVHGEVSVAAAVAAAARDVLVRVLADVGDPFPPECAAAGIASAEGDYAAALAGIPDGAARAAGIALGQAAAAAILTLRVDDGSDTPLLDFAYPQGTAPGEYRATHGVPFVFAPGWGRVTPFVLTDAAQFRPAPPLDVRSRRYAAEFAEVKALGRVDSSERTVEETEIGLFWLESSPLAWNRLARDVAARKRLSPWETARLFGLLNLALADGYIASWAAKFHYNFWRPVTAIHTADSDGNPKTEADPTWEPLQQTYPMPDHDSAHSVEGGAAAEVLKQFFGTDKIAFRACSLTLPAGSTCNDPEPVFRRYERFSDAANENGRSRILVGIHFRTAVEEGIEHGRRIGRRAADRFLLPVHRRKHQARDDK